MDFVFCSASAEWVIFEGLRTQKVPFALFDRFHDIILFILCTWKIYIWWLAPHYLWTLSQMNFSLASEVSKTKVCKFNCRNQKFSKVVLCTLFNKDLHIVILEVFHNCLMDAEHFYCVSNLLEIVIESANWGHIFDHVLPGLLYDWGVIVGHYYFEINSRKNHHECNTKLNFSRSWLAFRSKALYFLEINLLKVFFELMLNFNVFFS